MGVQLEIKDLDRLDAKDQVKVKGRAKVKVRVNVYQNLVKMKKTVSLNSK